MEAPADGTRHTFQAADYAVCGSIMLASLAIGAYYGLSGGRQRTSAEYLLADRRMTVVPVTLSLLATSFSTMTVVGIPAEVYFRGTMVMWMSSPAIISGFLALYFFLPLYYKLRVTSVYEYLEIRFNRTVLACGVFAFAMYTVLYMGLVTFIAAVATTAVTGISFAVAVVAIIGVCAAYTVIGGIRAVMWVDSLQMLIVFATVMIVIIKGSLEMGGIANVWGIAQEGRRIQFLNLSLDPTEYYTVWGILIGQLASAASVHINSQYTVQRYLACKSLTVAKTALVAMLFGGTLFTFLSVLAGMAIYAFYAGCDPLSRGYLKKQDEILPYFIIEVFQGAPGVAGILLSGILSAALSTVSSALNGLAALFGEHLVKPCWRTLNDERYTTVLKGISALFALIVLGMAFMVTKVGSAIPTLFAIWGAVNGPLVAVYLLGAFYPRCSAKGAFVAYIVGATVGAWLAVGNILHGGASSAELPLSTDECTADNTTLGNATGFVALSGFTTAPPDVNLTAGGPKEQSGPVFGPLYAVSRVWYPTATCILSILVGVVTTLIIGGNNPDDVDPRLYVPVSRWCRCAWPFRQKHQDVNPAKDVELKVKAPGYKPISQSIQDRQLIASDNGENWEKATTDENQAQRRKDLSED